MANISGVCDDVIEDYLENRLKNFWKSLEL